jgi:anti-sigma B factor antagonist
MKIEVRESGKVRILDLHGRLVLGPPTDSLKDTLHGLLADGHLWILINLRGVPYMDSAGIGELAACKKRVLERKGGIAVQRVPGRYHLAVETLLVLMFPDALFDDELAALATLD